MFKKRLQLFLIGTSFLLTCFVSCEKKPSEILASNVTLDKTSVEIPIGHTALLSAEVYPENTTDKTIVWSSSDKTVAQVEDGLVSALKIGKAEVKATCGDKYAKCAVSVVPVEVESIILDKKELSLRTGETVTLTATISPSDATDKSVTWTSSDTSVATVENGTVKAIKAGNTTITAKAGDKTAACNVSVYLSTSGNETVGEIDGEW